MTRPSVSGRASEHAATRGARRARVRRVVQLLAAALGWWAAYRVNAPVWDRLLFDVAGLDPRSRLGEAVRFFCYDTVKIVLLLAAIVFVVTVLRSFMSVERTRALLGGRREGVGNLMAAGLGVLTPFCSCSAVPAFIGFVAAGIPIGVTLSFLVASPLVNEVAVGLLASMFGWRTALLYVAAGLTVAVVSGWTLGRLGVERWVEPFVFETRLRGDVVQDTEALSFPDRLAMGREEVVTVLRRIWLYLVVGIGLGAVLHGWAPTDVFARYAGPDSAFGVVVAVGIGVPLYSNAAGVMPLVEVLHDKGLPTGTLLAFMMSVVALSLPELVLLRRVLRLPLLAAFVGVVAGGIVAVGYLFNALLA